MIFLFKRKVLHNCSTRSLTKRASSNLTDDGTHDIILTNVFKRSLRTKDVNISLSSYETLRQTAASNLTPKDLSELLYLVVDKGDVSTKEITLVERIHSDIQQRRFLQKDHLMFGREIDAMVQLNARLGNIDRMLSYYTHYTNIGLKPTPEICIITINALLNSDHIQKNQLLHSFLDIIYRDDALRKDTQFFLAILHVLSSNGLVDNAKMTIEKLGPTQFPRPLLKEFNYLTIAHLKYGNEIGAQSVLKDISSKNLTPNDDTFNAFLDYYASKSDSQSALQVYNLLVAKKDPSEETFINLLRLFSNMGDVENTIRKKEEFQKSFTQDEVSTTLAELNGFIVAAYIKANRLTDCKEFLISGSNAQMKSEGRVFGLLMQAYSDSGLLAEANELWRFTTDHKIIHSHIYEPFVLILLKNQENNRGIRILVQEAECISIPSLQCLEKIAGFMDNHTFVTSNISDIHIFLGICNRVGCKLSTHVCNTLVANEIHQFNQKLDSAKELCDIRSLLELYHKSMESSIDCTTVEMLTQAMDTIPGIVTMKNFETLMTLLEANSNTISTDVKNKIASIASKLTDIV